MAPISAVVRPPGQRVHGRALKPAAGEQAQYDGALCRPATHREGGFVRWMLLRSIQSLLRKNHCEL